MKIFEYIVNPKKIFLSIISRGFLNCLSDKTYLRLYFLCRLNKKLDLDSPKTFNEKLQWLKLYDRNPEYTKMVDKYEVKEYVSSIIGEEYVIPTLGVWNRFEDIDFDKLPNQFVLKCTHDSGGVIIVKDKEKLDKQSAKKKINKSLKRNYYYNGREWPYKNVKPRIIAETYMEDSKTKELRDYKFMCFGGKVKCSFCCTERYSEDGLKVTFFDREWNVMPFERHYPKSSKEILRPQNYDKMIELSETLAKNIPFVRIDFYEINNQIYFGELTFYPGSGFEEFEPFEWDKKMGDMIKLPNKKN